MAPADHRQAEAFGQHCRDIFHGMDRHVCLTLEHGRFELFDKKAFAAYFGKRGIQPLVAICRNPDQIHLQRSIQALQLTSHKLRLPHCEHAFPGGDPYG